MEKYTVTDKFVNFGIGDVLELTDKQYDSRQHHLKKLKDGKYYVSQPVQFKRGEIVGLAKEPVKEMLSKLSPCEPKIETSKMVATDINTARLNTAVQPAKEKKKDDVKN